jgi:hypothetical protein
MITRLSQLEVSPSLDNTFHVHIPLPKYTYAQTQLAVLLYCDDQLLEIYEITPTRTVEDILSMASQAVKLHAYRVLTSSRV